ncbi:hypothetical protein DPMN_137550 [Dreissena polymorpha]|uniref:Uncharacterized protein n=1 Tax=Dreissena polymorpha TaxID=45954 RepID=A0A9D4G4Y0_DREPO|nr:hypothetical protein DPMN_137550 [Dreissena polymorpha]
MLQPTFMNSEHPGGHVFQQTRYILVHIQHIIKTNILTKCREDWTINVTLRVLTSLYNSHMRKNAPPPGGHVFQPTGTIFKLFHEDQRINMASRVFTRKNTPPPGAHVFQPTGTIFKLFHEDQRINMASRVFTRKNTPPPGAHVFQPTGTFCKLILDMIGTNLLTKFRDDWTINVAFRVLIRMNLLTNVNKVLQNPYKAILGKNDPPPGGHVFKATGTIFQLVQDIIGTNLQTKFHDDWTIIKCGL